MSDNTTQLTSGYNDWQHLSHILKVHKTSVGHIKNSSKYSELRMSLKKIAQLMQCNNDSIKPKKNIGDGS